MDPFTQGVVSPGNWRIGCQRPLPALAGNRNWPRSSLCASVCVCAIAQQTGQPARVQRSPGVSPSRTQRVCINMAGRTGKWGGIAIRGHTCCTPARHTPHAAFMDAPGRGHMQSYQNTHFLRRAAQRQTEPALISDFGTFCSSLPTTPRPSTRRRRAARQGISRRRGGCDSQRNPLSLALPHTSQSTGEFLIHRTAQSG